MRFVKCVLVLAAAGAALLLLASAYAQAAPPAPVPAAGVAVPSTHVPAETEALLPVVVTPKMRRYARTGYALYFAGVAYSWLLLAGVLALGVSAKMRDAAERWAPKPWRRMIVYYGLLTLALAAAHLPLTWYSGWWRQRAYGLSSQSFMAWLGDWAKSEAVSFVLAIPLLMLLLWLVRKSPRRWSLWLWAASVPIVAFGIFLAPLLVDPLFNKFTPLPPGPLRVRIERLAAQAGIPNAPIYVVDKSRQTNTANAYVTGIGSSARIVIWDTTLQQLPPDEVVGVVAHEMGHYVLKHIPWGFAESIAGLLILLPLTQWATTKIVAARGARWHLRGVGDMAAIPVFLLVVSVLGFLSEPVTNGLSRRVEHQADAYGLAATGNGPALARAFAHFAEHDLSDPYPPPPIKFWLFSHPPIGERIKFMLGRKSSAPRGT